MSDDWIRASELGEYLYCRRSWWLRRVKGYRPNNTPQRTTGDTYHQQHYERVQQSENLTRAVTIFMALLLTISALVVAWWFLAQG
jgi:CRISPR/Cas system-associated exonuclease Cas4 (RecB family)